MNGPTDEGIDIKSSICSRISPASLQGILPFATVLHGIDGNHEPVKIYAYLLSHERNPVPICVLLLNTFYHLLGFSTLRRCGGIDQSVGQTEGAVSLNPSSAHSSG